jgi:hypothetical protein
LRESNGETLALNARRLIRRALTGASFALAARYG